MWCLWKLFKKIQGPRKTKSWSVMALIVIVLRGILLPEVVAFRESINQHLGFKWVTKSWSNDILHSSAYQLKALEFVHSAFPYLCQHAHQRCAGIGLQLHPLKAKYWMRDNLYLQFLAWCSLINVFDVYIQYGIIYSALLHLLRQLFFGQQPR